MSELKPDAWMVIECGCRAPDDCEDYETLFTNEEWERVKGDYQRHVEHDRAFPLYADTSAIEAAVLEKLRIEMDDFDPKDSHVFMAGQIKCIAMLDEALAALSIEEGARDEIS